MPIQLLLFVKSEQYQEFPPWDPSRGFRGAMQATTPLAFIAVLYRTDQPF
jgi:hypothetical protein